ncbi:MAG: hypothetical protein FJY10_03025 [Bacteroidetes bacterium]|nr:hypothetical protein [Bacteroidota bacterium]
MDQETNTLHFHQKGYWFIFTLLLTGFLLLFHNTSAQKKEKYDSLFIAKHSPTRATVMSALCPGLGQIYNKKYWKPPIIYAGFGVLTYFAITNTQEYQKFRGAYNCKINNDSTSKYFELASKYEEKSLLSAREYYRRNLEVTYLLCAVLYVLNIVDASVDAHLLTFDVSDKLAIRIDPIIPQVNPVMQPGNAGLRVSFNF